MINFINSWLEGIVIAVVVSVIIEMIIPEGKNKKYIKTIIGIYIMFVIISPIISNKNSINAEKLLKTTSNGYSKEIETININKEMQMAYEEKMNQAIAEELLAKGYTLTKMELSYKTQEENFGEINGIEIYIVKEENKVKNIEKISIDVSQEYNDNEEKISQEEAEKIKGILSEYCGISREQIKVYGG